MSDNSQDGKIEKLRGKLTIAVSSRALFDLEEGHRIHQKEGLAAYREHHRRHENDVLKPGVAFKLVSKFLRLNDGQTLPRIEVLLLSRMHADTSLRVFNSIEHYGLDIRRAAFTGGRNPFNYLAPFHAHLYLSADAEAVRLALDHGFAAARILPADVGATDDDQQLRIAFDGDAVIFSDEAERVFKMEGLDAFTRNERDLARQPLSAGPFRNFLAMVHGLQSDYPDDAAPIRTALITARSMSAHERVIRTLDSWGVRLDESLFLAGMDKGEFLQAFGADIFFDDQRKHCDSARRFVPTGHVMHGIANPAPERMDTDVTVAVAAETRQEQA